MKKLIKNGFVLLMSVTFSIHTYSTSSFNAYEEIVLDSGYVTKGTLFIVKNTKGKIIHKKVFEKSENFNEDLGLLDLKDGNYTMELIKDLEIKVIPFKVVTNKVIIEDNKSYSIFKPFVCVKNRLVYLTRLSLHMEDLNLEIYDIENNLIYSEFIKEEMAVQRVYDFSKLDDKTFKIQMVSKGRTFVEKLQF